MSVHPAIEWSCGNETVRAIAYGEGPSDLQVTLDDAVRPVVVTRVLLHCLRDECGQPFSEDTVWQWDLTRRLQGLLAVAVASNGRHQLVEAYCDNPECEAALDLDVDLAMFSETRSPLTVTCRAADGNELQVRVPSGADQLAWLKRWPFGQPEEAAMAATLLDKVDGGDPPPDWRLDEATLTVVADALAEADVLTDIHLETECVECNTAISAALDLESHVLARLRMRRAQLFDQVHALALEYHWSESEILSLPGDRRRAYLRRLGWEAWA